MSMQVIWFRERGPVLGTHSREEFLITSELKEFTSIPFSDDGA
jgi:hypothetical protein